MNKGSLKTGNLPPETPDKMIVTPTLNRWGNGPESEAPLQRYLSSLLQLAHRDGIGEESMILISDASSPTVSNIRDQVIAGLQAKKNSPELYFLTPELQDQVAQKIGEKLRDIRPEIIRAIVCDTGYANQRIKLDTVAAGYVCESDKSTAVLGFDDDLEFPKEYGILKPNYFPAGTTPPRNSQLILHERALRDNMFEYHPNSLRDFFEYLGNTVKEVREKVGSLRITQTQRDTMHAMLDQAAMGKVVQFEVGSGDDPLPDADQARILATTATKHGVPDFRTVKIAQQNYQKEFPSHEVPLQSVLAGQSKSHGFRVSHTNIDSAAMSRYVDSKTALYPWWFVSSDQISRQNPLQTVTGHYRADNELLPGLMQTITEQTGESVIYLSGINSHPNHVRSRVGYRPNLHEQATASLIGNIAATEAQKRLRIDASTGSTHLEWNPESETKYEAPEAISRKAYEELHRLADICKSKLGEVKLRNKTPENQSKIEKYQQAHQSLEKKLGGFDYEVFKRHLDIEIRDQLTFYRDVLKAFGPIVDEIRAMIRNEKYPAMKRVWTPEQTSVYYRHQPTMA